MMRTLCLSTLLAAGLPLLGCDDGASPTATPDAAAQGTDGGALDQAPLPDGDPGDLSPADAVSPDAAPLDAAGPDALADAAPPNPDAEPPPPACPRAVPAEAAALGAAPIDGVLCANASQWFKVDLAADTELSVLLDFTHADGDLELRLFAADDLSRALADSTSATDRERVGRAPGAAQALFVEIYGYRGAGGAFRLTAYTLPTADRAPAEAGGWVTFDDRLFDPAGFTGEQRRQPAERLVVQARRTLDDAVVAEALTDADGRFDLRWGADPEQRYWLEAVAEARVGERAGRAVSRERTARLYALTSEPFAAPDAPTDLRLHAAGGEAIAGALHIAHVMGEGLTFIDPFVSGAAEVTVRWQAGQPFPCGSCYGRDEISLGGQLEDPDEFDDAIILHELGHWFVDHFSDDDSPGGSHRDRQVTPTLAYGEGLAYFFAAMIRDDPDLVDNFLDASRYIDLEAVTQQGEALDVLRGTTDGTEAGDLREELVGGVLWDAYDGPSEQEPFDGVTLGVDGSMAILTEDFGGRPPPDVGARGIDLADWLEAAACRVDPVALQPLVDDRAFPWTVRGGACAEKQRVPTPFVLVARKGTVWWVPDRGVALPPLLVYRDGAAPVALPCAGACPLGPATPDTQLIVTAPGAPWPGASWLGAKALADRLGGTPRGDRRVYRSRP